ncbi:MAG: glycosyltransferase family 2 protein [Nocardioides sp.]|nr:glycosyltransferase family 2 protein [Nocardioides sp.]
MTADGTAARRHPTLTIGLPVYNGERYLREAMDALLAQTYSDFELIISDNASTDTTEDICRAYARKDARVRYIRQPTNVGAVPNHNLLVREARGRYFKWASHDDLYAPELLERCVQLLERHPEAVLAHCWDAVIDDTGRVVREDPYVLDTASPDPAARLRSLLRTPGGNDFYGVVRTDVLRRVGGHRTYYNADRTFVATLLMQGTFRQVPQVLYFRRDHRGRATRAGSARDRAAVLDPRRANRLRYPMPYMYTEYVLGFFVAIAKGRLSLRDRVRCSLEVLRWLAQVARSGPVWSVEHELDAT